MEGPPPIIVLILNFGWTQKPNICDPQLVLDLASNQFCERSEFPLFFGELKIKDQYLILFCEVGEALLTNDFFFKFKKWIVFKINNYWL